MTTVGATTTSKLYNADAIIRATDIGNAEICLLEISNAFDEAGRPKISFDRHKAMFGLLSMIKSIVQEYHHATYKELKKTKFIFIHTHGKLSLSSLLYLYIHPIYDIINMINLRYSIRVWSLYSPEAGVYVMNKELKMPSPVSFEKKEEHLFDFLEGSWKLTVSTTVALLGGL